MSDTFDESLCGTCETTGDFGGDTGTGGDSGTPDEGSGGEVELDTPGNGTFVSAVTVPGGIKVRWDYPSTNPHAVAHALLYRSASNSFANASVRTLLDGNEFIDWIDLNTAQTYYYWIRFISVSGTPLSPVGPGSATHDPSLVQEDTGPSEIALGDLSLELQALFGQIPVLSKAVEDAAISQEEADDLLALSIADLDSRITARVNAAEAKVAELETTSTQMQDIANSVQAEFDSRLKSIAMTQAEYEALAAPEPDVLYVITE